MPGLTERRKDLLATLMKDAIHEAAVVVLTEHGLNGVTMDRVAEQAGIAKGSLYNYFPNKQALLRFVHERAIEPLVEEAAAILRSDLPAVAKLEATLRIWFESIDSQRGVFNLFFMDHAVRELIKYEEATGRAYALEHLSAILRQGMEEGKFRPVDAERTACLLFGASREICEQEMRTHRQWPIRQLVGEVMGLFLHGMGIAR